MASSSVVIPDSQLSEWGALADAATAGPWKAFRLAPTGGLHGRSATLMVGDVNGDNVAIAGFANDHDFIAAAREAVPSLIGEVRRLRTELDAALAEGATIGAMLAAHRPPPKLHPNATRERATYPLDEDA